MQRKVLEALLGTAMTLTPIAGHRGLEKFGFQFVDNIQAYLIIRIGLFLKCTVVIFGPGSLGMA